MRKDYLSWLLTIALYIVVILGVNLVLIFIYSVITGLLGGTAMFEVPSYFRTLSNALFFEGALILTAGTFLEFFARASSGPVAKILMRASEAILRRMAPEEKNRDTAGLEEERSGGWMLIFIGALMIALSAISAIISMK